MSEITRSYWAGMDVIAFAIVPFDTILVTEREAREADDRSVFERLVMRRLMPFLWRAMPVHDLPGGEGQE